MQFADIILPLNLPQTLTYAIPTPWQEKVKIGMRVEVNLGKNKLYAGVILRLHNNKPETFSVKPIKNLIDNQPIVFPVQLQFWQWIAQYYMCSIGEVMQAALPAHLKLMSESLLVWSDMYQDIPEGLSDDAFLLAEALLIRKNITINEARSIVQTGNPSKGINEVLESGAAVVSEILEEKYKLKKEKIVVLHPEYKNEQKLNDLFQSLNKKEKQLNVLMQLITLQQRHNTVTLKLLKEQPSISSSSIDTLINKGVLQIQEIIVDRLPNNFTDTNTKEYSLSAAQQTALTEIETHWKSQSNVLLQGLTGSGKTLIYIELIKQAIAQGKQVLYLIPEIALTTQLVSRLRAYFGDELGVYHSQFSNNERVEIWNKVKDQTYKVIVGARSALWLPFQELSHIIIDEEHDQSYKQQDPAPRFQARDAAIYLASLHHAKVLLGSATPSMESLYNIQTHKYGFVALRERYNNVSMPTIEIVNAKNIQAALSTILTTPLLEAIQRNYQQGKQAILFQNKRGYAPFLICTSCGFVPQCKYCDVSLTYHKNTDKLHCHYCGSRTAPIKHCPQCGNTNITAKSFGTEKIEEEIQRILPKIKTARMDWDSMRGRNKMTQLISDFARGKIDVLVGTQMVVKGLDFGNVNLVGIISADSLWSYPDFRVNERAYQLITQVSGRAGRADGNGKVIIQAHKTDHPILQWITNNDFKSFYHTEMVMRQAYNYPPFSKVIKVICKHRNSNTAQAAAQDIAQHLTQTNSLLHLQGPAEALVPRVRNNYIFEIWLKLPKNSHSINQIKEQIALAINEVLRKKGNNALQVIVDVDSM